MIKLPLDQNGYPVLILGIGECQDSTGGKITPVGDVMRLAANAAPRIWYYPSTEVKVGPGMLLPGGAIEYFAITTGWTLEIEGDVNVMTL